MVRPQLVPSSSDPLAPATWWQPPPSYPPLCGKAAKARGETNNLFSHFLDMRTLEEAHGSDDPYPDPAVYGEVVPSPDAMLAKSW